MQRAVIAIGVKKTGGLPELQAAVQSAAAFAAWAKEHQRIDRVRLITDEKSKVTRDRIFEAVEKITELGFIEQLIVYFSGHGINIGQAERWLLSRAPGDPGAAVNVHGSELNARFCGVGHVVFVSDACRTAADSIQAQNVTGSEIFPNLSRTGPERPVDQFFATLVGHPALEVKSVQDAAGAYRAAYSDVLLQTLRGDVPEVIETDPVGRVVRAWPLKKHLLNAVPQFLRQLGLTSMTQQPDARIESEPAAWLSLCPAASPTAAAASTAKRRRARAGPRPTLAGDVVLPPTAMEHDAAGPGGLLHEAREALNVVLRPDAPGPVRRRARGVPRRGTTDAPTATGLSVALAAGRAAAGFGPDHFETECGIKVRGARIPESLAKHAAVRIGTRGDTVQVDLHRNRRAANVVLRLDDSSAVLVAAFSGYVTSLSFDREGLLEDIAYEPSANAAGWREYARTAGDLRQLRAVMAGTASFGLFRLDDAIDAERLMERILGQATPDPAMAVLAAHALHDRRMRAAIRTLDRHLVDRLGVRVFDVALLTFSLRGTPAPDDTPPVYPCIPMLTQGWSLLSPLDVRLQGRLGELRGHLRPSLWSHFRAEAADLLFDAVRSGKVG